MGFLLALLIVLCAAPCYAVGNYYYVNPSATSARNLPLASGYGQSPTDSPWITPSYALAALVYTDDTLVIYAHGTDTYYADKMNITSDTVSLVGVSVNGDSPTFSKGGELTVLYNNTVGLNLRNQCLRGFRFTNENIPGNPLIYYYAYDFNNFTIADNIFDSIVYTGMSASYDGAVYIEGRSTDHFIDNVYITNNSFVNIQHGAGIYIHPATAGCTLNVTLTNNTARNCESAFKRFDTNLNTVFSNFIVRDNIFVSCDYDMAYNSNGFGSVTYTYNDTHDVRLSQYGTAGSFSLTMSNNINVDPQWYYGLTDAGAGWSYLSDASTLNDKSSTGGYIGVLPRGWVYAGDPPAPPAMQLTGPRSSFLSRWYPVWSRRR
jgi:hypothetical protein